MRNIVHDALAGTRDMIGELRADLQGQSQLSEDEALGQYDQLRGNNAAILKFTVERMQSGADAMSEATRYVKAMERLRRQKGA